LKVEGAPITGEEGSVWFLSEPLRGVGTDVVKQFYTNYGFIVDGMPLFGLTLTRHPRFLYSQYREGFQRLYHVTSIAKNIFPGEVFDLRGVLMPDEMPAYFDVYNPPHMKEDGSIQYPQFTSKRVPVIPEQEAAMRRLYKHVDKHRTTLIDEFHAGGGRLSPQESMGYVSRSRAINAAMSSYCDCVVKGASKMGLSFPRLELRLIEAGFAPPHMEVNTLLSPSKGGEPARLVVCEVGEYFDEGKVRQAVEGVQDRIRRKSARHHLKEAVALDSALYEKISDSMAEMRQLGEIMTRIHAHLDKRPSALMEMIAAEDKKR